MNGSIEAAVGALASTLGNGVGECPVASAPLPGAPRPRHPNASTRLKIDQPRAAADMSEVSHASRVQWRGVRDGAPVLRVPAAIALLWLHMSRWPALLRARWIVIALTATFVAAGACVDLDSLGNGSLPNGDAAAIDAPEPSSSCPRDAAALFEDDFDDLAWDAGARWPGALGVLASPVKVGNMGFERVSEGASSPPYAVAFFGTRAPGEPLPFVGFGKDLGVRTLRLPALALTAEVRLEELSLASDAGPFDAGMIGDAIAPPGPRTTVLAFIALVQGTEGVQLVFSRRSLELVTGNAEQSTAKVMAVPDYDFLYTSAVGWFRVGLAVGSWPAVQKYVREKSETRVDCPHAETAVAAVWSTIPIGTAACIVATDGFLPTAEKRVGATVGAALDLPGSVRVLVDNVRVDPIYFCGE